MEIALSEKKDEGEKQVEVIGLGEGGIPRWKLRWRINRSGICREPNCYLYHPIRRIHNGDSTIVNADDFFSDGQPEP